MIEAAIDEYAKIIWDYMQLHEDPKPSDAIFCLGSADTRSAERAADLFLEGLSSWLIFSGGYGARTKDLFKKPEAEVFADIAIQKGVAKDKILIENKSTNTGENITLSYQLLREKNLKLSSFILVDKPYKERRTFATFKKQWPDPQPQISVTSPQIAYEDYFNEVDTRPVVINIMVGDMQRIREYPKKGFQIEQEIPDKVWDAYKKLVAAGFTKYLV